MGPSPVPIKARFILKHFATFFAFTDFFVQVDSVGMNFDHFVVLEGLAADGTRWKAVNLIAMRSIIANCVETNLVKKQVGICIQ